MKKVSLFIFALLVTTMLFSDSRSESIDFFILFDKSKSMYDKIEKARLYTAQEILGRYVIPNDWVCLIAFYGKTRIVYKSLITNEQEKKQLIQSLLKIEADGRYTDIGNALDFLKQEILNRGHPERPKYILLITDLRQEAPPESIYQSSDYTISHPALQYVLKKEINNFYVITLGMNIEDKAQDLASYVIETLQQLPERNFEQIPGGATDTTTSKQETYQQTESAQSQLKQNMNTSTILIITLCFFLGIATVLVFILIRRKNSDKKDSK